MINGPPNFGASHYVSFFFILSTDISAFFFLFFFSEYLWGFAKSTAPHPKLHPSVFITK